MKNNFLALNEIQLLGMWQYGRRHFHKVCLPFRKGQHARSFAHLTFVPLLP